MRKTRRRFLQDVLNFDAPAAAITNTILNVLASFWTDNYANLSNSCRNKSFNSLKVMMVTTQNSMDRVSAALEAGADDFLMKPVTKESLEEKLQILGIV